MAKIPLEEINGSEESFSILITDQFGNPSYLDRPETEAFLKIGPSGFSFVTQNDAQDNSKLELTVNTDGQSIFNIGMSEGRTKLWLNGIPQNRDEDYTIVLPLLTWIASYPLSTTDEIYLTYI
jgi:hypothetical protein